MIAEVETIQKCLHDIQPAGYELNVIEEAVRKDDDWWYVPVRISKPMPRTYEYYEILSEAEEKLADSENLNVMLVPTAPEE